MTQESGFEPPFGYGRGATYNGYSAPAQPQMAPAAVVPHRPTRGVVVASGVAAALVLGLTVGYFAQPDLASSDTAAKPMAPAPAGAQQGLTIQPGAPRPMTVTAAPLPVTSAGKLEVLPPDMARAAQRSAPFAAPAASGAVRDVSAVVADPAPPAVADPELAEADGAMTRAYRRALRAGAMPPEQLRAEQQDWMSIRDDAARRSPRALARAYDQRIDELNQLADEGPNF